jgi:imidazolonepropionase-like amidohydrolase
MERTRGRSTWCRAARRALFATLACAALGAGASSPIIAQTPESSSLEGGAIKGLASPLVFTGVTVVDVKDGKLLSGQNVLIVGNRIKAIGPDKKVKIPKDAQIIDAKGKYLIPGMWDMHPHVDQHANQLYPMFVAHGVTGLREMAQRFPNGTDSFYKWQGEVLAGTRVGPRIIGPSADLTYNMILRRPEDARRIMDSLKAAKVAFIKFHDSQMYSRELFFAIMREARRTGLMVVGHVPRRITNVEASDSGMHSIEHIEENHQCWPNWPKLLGDSATADARCKPMIDAYIKNGTYMMVGLNGHWLDDQYRPDKQTGLWEDQKRFVRMLYRMGFRRFITGTDWAPMFAGWDKRFRPGLSAVEDLITYNIDVGLSPLEALQTGTLNPAKALNLTDSLGTVEVGKLADLVLLDGNPLENIRNVLNVRGVMVNGFYYNREQLTAMDPEGTKPDMGLIAAREGRSPAVAKADPQPAATPTPTLQELSDTTQPVVTLEDVEQLLTFLRATLSEWQKPEVAEFYQTNLVKYPITIGDVGGPVPATFKGASFAAPDMGALADKFPTVKAALEQAKLTPLRYMQLHRAILCASLTDQLDRAMHEGKSTTSTDTTSVINKNVAFLRANPKVEPDLRAAGLELPMIQKR